MLLMTTCFGVSGCTGTHQYLSCYNTSEMAPGQGRTFTYKMTINKFCIISSHLINYITGRLKYERCKSTIDKRFSSFTFTSFLTTLLELG